MWYCLCYVAVTTVNDFGFTLAAFRWKKSAGYLNIKDLVNLINQSSYYGDVESMDNWILLRS